jgi:hypothetical protein
MGSHGIRVHSHGIKKSAYIKARQGVSTQIINQLYCKPKERIRQMKIIRYSKNNGALYIGTHSSKLCIFTRDWAGYLAVGGKRIAQFG